MTTMMTEPSQLTACVIDNGLFLPLARRLAPRFGRMLYFSEWRDGFPTLNKRIVGDGFDEIERVDDFWEYRDEIDLFIFPDIYRSGLQAELARQGKLVWGSRTGDELEIYRNSFLNTLQDLGLPVSQYDQVVGVSELRELLKDKEDVYVKISKFRGTMETFHWRNWRLDDGWLDQLGVKLGLAKEELPFLVFPAIDVKVEIGGDTYCIDGQWPSLMINGDEHKDKGYIGAVTRRDEMPDEVQEVLAKFGPVLAQHQYRNAFSMEIRPPYFIDPCCRFPCPGHSAASALIGNMAEIIVAGAQGELVEPEMTAKYAAECVLKTKFEKGQWLYADFPEELDGSVSVANCCAIEGRIGFPPSDHRDDDIGWLFTTGDTIKEAVTAMKAKANLLPDGISACTDSLFELLKTIEEGERQGYSFGAGDLPHPTVALET